MDLIWKKLKTVDEIKLLLAPHNEDAKYIVSDFVQHRKLKYCCI